MPHEEETYLSTACRSSFLAPPHTYVILGNPARTRSSPSIQNTHLSSPSVLQSRSSPRIIILSNPAREKQCAMPRSKRVQSKQKASATLMRVPTTPPISILKTPVPAPQPLAPAIDIKVGKPAVDGKARNVIVKVLLQVPKIIVRESVSCEARANTGVHHAGTGTGTDKTGHVAEKFVRRLGLMIQVRSGSRLVATRRREHPRNCR